MITAKRIRVAAEILFKTVFFYVCGVFWVGLVAYVIPVPIAIVERLLGRAPDRALAILHWGIRVTSIFYRAAAEIRIDQQHVAPPPAVVICNHHSFFDIYLLLHVFPLLRLSARRTLYRIPFLGWAMALLGHFPHDPKDPQVAIDRGLKWLRRGVYVGMFPEGTRAPGGVIGPFQSGAFRLAQQAGVPIQPVVAVGTDRVWPKRAGWIRQLGPVHLRVLPVVRIDPTLGRRGLLESIEAIRRRMLDEHQRMERELFG